MTQSILAGIMIALAAGIYLIVSGLLGANYCIADMVYMYLAATNEMFIPMTTAIFYATIGNVIGASIIPYSQ